MSFDIATAHWHPCSFGRLFWSINQRGILRCDTHPGQGIRPHHIVHVYRNADVAHRHGRHRSTFDRDDEAGNWHFLRLHSHAGALLAQSPKISTQRTRELWAITSRMSRKIAMSLFHQVWWKASNLTKSHVDMPVFLMHNHQQEAWDGRNLYYFQLQIYARALQTVFTMQRNLLMFVHKLTIQALSVSTFQGIGIVKIASDTTYGHLCRMVPPRSGQ